MTTPKASFDLSQISRQVSSDGKKIPPVDQWNPDFCGDIDMKILRNGQWMYNGTPIGREAMVKLFSSILWKEEDKYFLKTPVEKVGIEVEDAPFHIVSLDVKEGALGQELHFTTKTDDHIVVDQSHPLRVETDPITGEPSPYVYVRFGMEALVNRSVFYQLVELAQEITVDNVPSLVVYSSGNPYILGTV